MGSLGRLWARLDHLKKDNEGVIDVNKLLELLEQWVIFIEHCHSRGSYFRRQRVLGPLFKDSCNVSSLLQKSLLFWEKTEVPFWWIVSKQG